MSADPGVSLKAALAVPLNTLAKEGIFVETSSWKHEGWLGQAYTRERYVYRGKFATSRFERDCLVEYAETFKTVCVDAAYYTFPRVEYLQGLASQVPADFRFGFKATDAITVRQFPNLDRFGPRAGQMNPDFLNADLFASSFLAACEQIRDKVGVLMFEFSRFGSTDYASGREFVADLDAFLSKLPKGWQYAIEMRNRHWLQGDYFECLRRHGVAHVFNSWQAMPSANEQMALPGSQTSDAFLAARFLLKPGRSYEAAVKAFSPYGQTKEVYEDARRAAMALIKDAQAKKKRAYIFVNNRLEGNAIATIAALLDGSFPVR